MSAQLLKEMDLKEIVDLSAVDSVFYGRAFFPGTFRQTSPAFHRNMFDLLESPEYQYVGLEAFRGSAKSTLARITISKRIAFGISRTIFPLSASAAHASRTIRWIKKQVESNTFWAQTFRLRKGSKWTDDELEIINETAECSIYAVAAGITGQVRGVNLDDYRPDLIIADDPCDEENTGTPDQREKTANLFFGALAPSLSPRSESPFSKMVLLQTCLMPGDLISMAHADPQWKTVRYPIFTQDGQSAWPERWSTDEVKQMKEGYTRRSQLHLWMREYECTLVSPESRPLKAEWLKYYDVPPEAMTVYIGIDPAREKSKNPHKTCMSCIGIHKKDVYLLDYFSQTHLNPEEIWAAFYRMAMKWRAFLVGVETVAFQQALAWYFKQKMEELQTYWVIQEVEDRRRKPDRIIQELTGKAFHGHFFVRADMDKWIEEYTTWQAGVDSDLLDSTALALTLAQPMLLTGDGGIPLEDETYIEDLPMAVGCP